VSLKEGDGILVYELDPDSDEPENARLQLYQMGPSKERVPVDDWSTVLVLDTHKLTEPSDGVSPTNSSSGGDERSEQ